MVNILKCLEGGPIDKSVSAVLMQFDYDGSQVDAWLTFF